MSAVNALAPVSTMEGIKQRLSRFNDEVHEIAHKLEQHAMAVHGSNALGGGSAKSVGEEIRDKADGALPAIHHALDDLEAAISRIAHAAGANTTLA